MVKINKTLQDSPHILYGPNNEEVGLIENYVQFNDVRIQIAKQKLEGYHFIINGTKHFINPNGSIQPYPHGLFDSADYQIADLFRIQRKNNERTNQ
jgi:hypothetical protein